MSTSWHLSRTFWKPCCSSVLLNSITWCVDWHNVVMCVKWIFHMRPAGVWCHATLAAWKMGGAVQRTWCCRCKKKNSTVFPPFAFSCSVCGLAGLGIQTLKLSGLFQQAIRMALCQESTWLREPVRHLEVTAPCFFPQLCRKREFSKSILQEAENLTVSPLRPFAELASRIHLCQTYPHTHAHVQTQICTRTYADLIKSDDPL